MLSSAWAAGLLVFATIFGFELVDRTNFAVIGLASRFDPRRVWMGAAGAFVVASVISVALGYALLAAVPSYLPLVQVAGGSVLVAFGVRAFYRADETRAERREVDPGSVARPRVALTAFGTVLLLEMGDNTQILTILFVGEVKDVALVLVASCLALVSVAALGATSGNLLRKRISARTLERLLAGILIVVGAATLALGVLELLRVRLPVLL